MIDPVCMVGTALMDGIGTSVIAHKQGFQDLHAEMVRKFFQWKINTLINSNVS